MLIRLHEGRIRKYLLLNMRVETRVDEHGHHQSRIENGRERMIGCRCCCGSGRRLLGSRRRRQQWFAKARHRVLILGLQRLRPFTDLVSHLLEFLVDVRTGIAIEDLRL